MTWNWMYYVWTLLTNEILHHVRKEEVIHHRMQYGWNHEAFFPFYEIQCIYNVTSMKTTKTNYESIGLNLNPKHETNESKQKYEG